MDKFQDEKIVFDELENREERILTTFSKNFDFYKLFFKKTSKKLFFCIKFLD